jgi:hypothetical protein
MNDRNNIELCIRELSADELEAVSGSATYTALLHAISDAMKKIEDASKNAISNIR